MLLICLFYNVYSFLILTTIFLWTYLSIMFFFSVFSTFVSHILQQVTLPSVTCILQLHWAYRSSFPIWHFPLFLIAVCVSLIVLASVCFSPAFPFFVSVFSFQLHSLHSPSSALSSFLSSADLLLFPPSVPLLGVSLAHLFPLRLRFLNQICFSPRGLNFQQGSS